MSVDGDSEMLDGIASCFLGDAISAVAFAREIDRFVKGTCMGSDAVKPLAVETIVRRYEAALA